MTETLEQIAARNRAKELDKAWETSWMRKGIIALMTYMSAVLLLWIIEVPSPQIAALVPVGGFILSTATLSPIKKWWISRQP